MMDVIANIFSGSSDEDEETRLTSSHVIQIGTRGGSLRYTSIPIHHVTGIRFQRTESRGFFVVACILAALTLLAWPLRHQMGMWAVYMFGTMAAVLLWCYYASRKVALQIQSSSTIISVLVAGKDETRFREFAQKVEEIQSNLLTPRAR
jgi:hypothetical protein